MPNFVRYSAILFALVAVSAARAAEPGSGTLVTRWAEQVSPQNALPEYPRPQMVRPQWLSLNGLWQLDLDRPADAVAAGVRLPQEVLVPYPIESTLSGVKKHSDRVWYRRTFQVPAEWKGNRVLLHFGAVDWEATVYVNGQELGTHRGGYDGFSFDITDALKPQAQQELLVRVFDPTDAGDQPRGKQVREPKGIWYTPTTGIWQTVWLEPVPAARIERLTLVPDLDKSCLRLTVQCTGTDSGHTIRAVIRDGQEQVAVATGATGTEIVLEIPQNRQKLWSPESPFLYDVEVVLQQGSEPVDTVQSYFGLRKIDMAADEQGAFRLRLNGRYFLQVGPLDQGFWPDGLYTAPTDEALRYDIEVTKQLGFNMTRKHVKIEPARWYYWCDKLGLLVWQDMPSANNTTPESQKQFEVELRQLIAGRGNHPSIIMWVVFNEGWGQHDTERYVELVKSMDPSRLVNNASGWTDKNVGHILDIHKYPGPGAPPKDPVRSGVLGEFGGLGLPVQGHLWTEQHWGYRAMGNADQLLRRYVNLLREVWSLEQTQGLSAAVYTQITDVETECNGLLTYDRAVIKVDPNAIAAANRGKVPKLTVLAPTATREAAPWRYTVGKPADDWNQPGFDAGAWPEGLGGFGTKKTPGSMVRTVWNSPDIWLRREFVLPEIDREKVFLVVHHDEDVEIYLNGVLAFEATGFTTDYEEIPLSAAAQEALKTGKNVLAVHCRQTGGGQYVDVGLVSLSE